MYVAGAYCALQQLEDGCGRYTKEQSAPGRGADD